MNSVMTFSGGNGRRGSGRVAGMESLEVRMLLAAAAAPISIEAPTLLDPTTIPQFVNNITGINPFVKRVPLYTGQQGGEPLHRRGLPDYAGPGIGHQSRNGFALPDGPVRLRS